MVERNEILLQLAKTLRSKRETLGLSQDTMAMRMGVTQRFISLIETGQTNPTYTTLIKYCNALGYRTPKLLFLNEDEFVV